MTLSTISSSLPAIHKVFDVSRGGATAAIASTVTQALDAQGGEEAAFLGPKPKAILCMAIAMSLHYLGYSFARPSTIALFTSSKTGYRSPAAFPLAMAFVSPVSIMLLVGYTRLLEACGPQGALTKSTIFCSGILFAAGTAILTLQDSNLSLFSVPLIKYIAGPLFVFRESYVQLLTSQYWSFMSSILTPEESSRWFAPIAGLTSITSALAGLNVARVVGKLGLAGAVFGTATMLLVSLIATTGAYSLADKHGFNPSDEENSHSKKGGSKAKKGVSADKEVGLLEKASTLFRRVPTLWALFIEVLSSQGLATLLNVCFVNKLSVAIPNDTERAGWMGKFFALINIITMCLQFGVLPPLMQVLEPRVLWRVLPMILLCFSGYQSSHADPSLYVVSTTLLIMKTLEYSARRMLDEMVFVPLDFESRYVGKEVVGVLAYRLGKSMMSLSLSGLTAVFGNFGLQELSMLSSGAACVWLTAAWNLSNFVPTKQEASELYKEKTKKGNKRK